MREYDEEFKDLPLDKEGFESGSERFYQGEKYNIYEVEPKEYRKVQFKELPEEEERREKRRLSFKRAVVITLIISIVGGFSLWAGITFTNTFLSPSSHAYRNEGLNSGGSQINIESINSYNTQMINSPIVEIAEKVGPAIVAITKKVSVRDWFNNRYTQEGLGSGVIFEIDDENIYILTNSHVISSAEELVVTIGENTNINAQVVGEDEATDLAIISIKKNEVPGEVLATISPAVFGDSDALKVGETAIAIGNPLGYNKTVTVGVISALNRDLNFADKNQRFLQTDAAINPGNSGGALVNIKGEVIGINTIKIADTTVEGIGFAIPINFAKPIIKELKEKGYVARPYLGIYGRDVDSYNSRLYDIPIGVIVAEVIENSPAQRAGLQKGDVIIEVDGTKITSMNQLSSIINDHEIGDTISVTIVRNGKERKTLTVTLGER